MDGAGTNSGAVWFAWVDQAEFGPTDLDQLRALKDKGVFKPDHWVRRADSDRWMPAGEIAHLFGPRSQVVTPPPLPAEALRVQSPDGADATGAVRPGPRSNYLARHWRGELSLPWSYWVNGVLGSIAATIIIVALSEGVMFKDEFRPALALIIILAIWMTAMSLTVWQSVGVWRSATTYASRHGRSYWGGLAKFMVCIAALRLVAAIGTTAVPQVTEFAKIFGGDKEFGGYRFQVLNGGQELDFTGGITFGAAKAFDEFADALTELKTVRLTSQGGRMAEAQRIAQQISKRGLNTYIADYCVSACTIMFLGGHERAINARSRVGFHQPDSPGLSDDERRAMLAAEQDRFVALGMSRAFAVKATASPPTSMWYPDVAELLAEHVATKVIDIGNAALADQRSSDQHFVSPDGSFSVDFDAVPKLEKELGLKLNNVSYDSYDWSVSTPADDRSVAMFVYASPVAFSYDAEIAATAESAQAKVLSQRPITRGGVEGREVVFEAPQSVHMRARMFFGKNRLVQIIFVGKPGDVGSPAADAFLDSLRLTF